MTTRILSMATLVTCFAVMFTSCQKNTTDEVDYSTESSTHSDDQSRFSSESDAAANDIQLAIEANTAFSGRGQSPQSLICDATIAVDPNSNPRTITITYLGTNCLGNRTRTGVIVLSMAQGVQWKNAGAIINVTFQNFKITRNSDNKSITINGTQTHTNVSGGLLFNLALLGTITHTISSTNMSITFDNGAQRNWSVARQRVFTYNNGIVVTETGTHTAGSTSGIAEWGTNRFGRVFTTAIAQPIVCRQDCSFRIGSGRVEHVTPLFNASVLFGLDVNGNATGCPGIGLYYMRITWTGPAGNTHSFLRPY